MANPTTQHEYVAPILRSKPGGVTGNTGEVRPGRFVRNRGSTQQSPPASNAMSKAPSILVRAAKARLAKTNLVGSQPEQTKAENTTYGPVFSK